MGFVWRFIFGNRFAMLGIGLVAVAAGIFMWNRVEVMCGSDAMRPGDTCEVTRRGSSNIYTYDEQKSQQLLSAKILTGVGGALTAGGLVWVIVKARRKPEPVEASVGA